MKRNVLFAMTSLAVVILDQISKLAVLRTMRVHETISVIPGFFNLVHVRNRGVAFGILNRPGGDLSYYLLIGATLLVVMFLLLWFRKISGAHGSAGFALSLVIGGAIGNLIDRIRLREVVDFLDLYIGSFHWPAFNVADSAVSVGSIWLAFLLLRHGNGKERQGG
ncbi:MAG: signal peptidase II [Thermodesulfobacteriota bacterium]